MAATVPDGAGSFPPSASADIHDGARRWVAGERMTADFDAWLRALYGPHEGEADPGDVVAGAMDLLRATFDGRGPLDRAEVDRVFQTVAMNLVQEAVSLFKADVTHTLNLQPSIEVYWHESGTLVVSWDGNYTTPAFHSMRAPEATCEVADNLQVHVVDDVGAAWPLCPTHGFGLHPHAISGSATWFCRYGDHQVSAIGQLPAAAGPRN